MTLSKNGVKILLEEYLKLKENHHGKFHTSNSLEEAYLTDMLQELVDIGIKVHCVIIERGWKEIDTVEDYQKSLKEFACSDLLPLFPQFHKKLFKR